MDSGSRRIAYERFTIIAPIIPYISDLIQRKYVINYVAEEKSISKQTIRNYLCLYLVYQNVSVLAPKKYKTENNLSQDEKNMRWALNKFYYTKKQNSLNLIIFPGMD